MKYRQERIMAWLLVLPFTLIPTWIALIINHYFASTGFWYAFGTGFSVHMQLEWLVRTWRIVRDIEVEDDKPRGLHVVGGQSVARQALGTKPGVQRTPARPAGLFEEKEAS